LVDYEAGLTIFKCAIGAYKSGNIHQHNMFN